MGDYAGARSAYDKVGASATNSRDRLHVQFQRALVSFWEGQPESGRKALDSVLEQARRQKEPYAQFEIGFGRAQLSANPATELEQLRAVEADCAESPVTGMSEPGPQHLPWPRSSAKKHASPPPTANLKPLQEAISKLERSAAITRDLVVENNYESSRGYALFAQGDFANASDELATDPHSPLAIQQLALAQDKLGNTAAAGVYAQAPEISARANRGMVSDDARRPRQSPQPAQ